MSKFTLGPKLVELSPDFSFAEFESWKSNVYYHLGLNEAFRPFLGLKFGKNRAQSLIEI